MELSNRITLPYVNIQPKLSPEKEQGLDQETAREPQLQALARLEQITDPELTAVPLAQPLAGPALTVSLPTSPSMIPPAQPQAVPIYLRDPGPPPGLPRNRNVQTIGRMSYRLNRAERNSSRYRNLLWACAFSGLVLLLVLVVFQPQNRPVSSPQLNETIIAAEAGLIAANNRPTVRPVPLAEQFAVVITGQGLVLDEPHDKALSVQNLAQYTFIAFQRKTNTAWYQLKGGFGWIKAGQVKTFETEEAAWEFKRASEKPPVTLA